ncbi:hypothetical protein ESCO_000924 [Escovopsis weberi]|uniref:DUF7053 domain-containing protein n=1 Tax=Escovopsis weberi TaxID=150374 RepID=A0A0M9VT90_ESCWE|nr:hypothetical protein ESCO_000924 [Escovopsis weberi]
MSSWLRTTGNVKHATKLPAGISSDRAIDVLHNHNFFISCDPHLVKFESIARPPAADDALPDRCRDDADGEPMFYAVTDRVQKLPAGLWDADVTSTYELVNLKRGLFVKLRSQMGVVMETVWDVREDGAGGAAITETVLIKASRLLIGIVKSMCENDWRVVHGKLLDIMGEEKA